MEHSKNRDRQSTFTRRDALLLPINKRTVNDPEKVAEDFKALFLTITANENIRLGEKDAFTFLRD
jgi:hypothetical protein